MCVNVCVTLTNTDADFVIDDVVDVKESADQPGRIFPGVCVGVCVS